MARLLMHGRPRLQMSGHRARTKARAARYLFLPPDYSGPIPNGYFVIRSSNYRIFARVPLNSAGRGDGCRSRCLQQDAQALPAIRGGCNLSPLGLSTVAPIRSNPAVLRYSRVEDIHDIISVEPVQPQDRVMMGMLATIGIERGKPFNPPAKLKSAMEKGVVDAYYYMQELDTKLFASNLYWPGRHWSFAMVPDAQHGFDFVDKDAVEIDQRAAAWFFFTFYPKVLTNQRGDSVSRAYRGPQRAATPSRQDLQAHRSKGHSCQTVLVTDDVRPCDLGVRQQSVGSGGPRLI